MILGKNLRVVSPLNAAYNVLVAFDIFVCSAQDDSSTDMNLFFIFMLLICVFKKHAGTTIFFINKDVGYAVHRKQKF